MTINVYWSCLEKEWMRAKKPEPIVNSFLENNKNKKEISNTIVCPSFKKNIKNTYSLNSIYDYEFTVRGDEVFTEVNDLEFFNRHVLVRSLEEKFFSFSQGMVFFTEEDGLELEVGLYPFFEQNNVTKNCILIPGSLDIGKWFRVLDFSFYLKNESDSFRIKEDEAYSYIRFNSKEKINFIEYYPTEKIKQYIDDTLDSRKSMPSVRSLQEYYRNFKIKNLILKEIKSNLIS